VPAHTMMCHELRSHGNAFRYGIAAGAILERRQMAFASPSQESRGEVSQRVRARGG